MLPAPPAPLHPLLNARGTRRTEEARGFVPPGFERSCPRNTIYSADPPRMVLRSPPPPPCLPLAKPFSNLYLPFISLSLSLSWPQWKIEHPRPCEVLPYYRSSISAAYYHTRLYPVTARGVSVLRRGTHGLQAYEPRRCKKTVVGLPSANSWGFSLRSGPLTRGIARVVSRGSLGAPLFRRLGAARADSWLVPR